MSSTPPAPRAARVNHATMLPRSFEGSLPGFSELELDAAVSTALRLCEGAPWSHPGRPGYRVFCARGGEAVYRDLPALPDAHLIIGRHTGCDVVLPDDPRISLRHLLVRAVLLDDGAAVLRLLDLQTNLPMFLPDGLPRRSLVVQGFVALRVGPYAVGALPIGTPSSGSPYRDAPRFFVCDEPRPPRASSSMPRITRITSLPPATGIGELSAQRGAPSMGRLTLYGRGCASSVELSEQHLELGVLVGRAPKCLRGMDAVFHTGISRAHVLLLRDTAGVHAFDLASVQGTFCEGRRIRHVLLSPAGTRLALASHPPVELSWETQLLH